MNIPNISYVVSTSETESRINQLKLMFLLLDRINFKSQFSSDDNSIYFIARARDTIIEEKNGMGNKVSVTLHNIEANLKLNITHVGQHIVPDTRNEPEHFQVELLNAPDKKLTFKTNICEEIYQFVLSNLDNDEILHPFSGVLGEDVLGMTKGNEYAFRRHIVNGLPTGYVKTRNDSGDEVLVDIDSFSSTMSTDLQSLVK